MSPDACWEGGTDPKPGRATGRFARCAIRSHKKRQACGYIGMVSAPDGEKLYNNKREDMVSLPATMTFLRANGLDSLVDGYAVHTYPSIDHPRDPAAAGRRAARFESVDLAPCRARDQQGGKPCWITEWGFPNRDFSCPTPDSARTLLVQETRVNFAKADAEHRLAGIVYFAWNSDPWSKQPDADSIYRCGGLNASGGLAIAPLPDVPTPLPYETMRISTFAQPASSPTSAQYSINAAIAGGVINARMSLFNATDQKHVLDSIQDSVGVRSNDRDVSPRNPETRCIPSPCARHCEDDEKRLDCP
jgi:hypothetical protein